VRRRWVVVAAAVLVVAAGVVAAALVHPGGDTATGTGLTYDGRFYWASGVQVKDSALGDHVASAVPFQDTTADLREIVGFDPRTTLAALLPSLNGSPGGLRWTFVSTDQGRGSDPAGFDDTRDVLVTPS
jgi:hypothetical protein